MKKFLIPLILALTVSASFAQTPATQARMDSFINAQAFAYKAFTSTLTFHGAAVKAKFDSINNLAIASQLAYDAKQYYGRFYTPSQAFRLDKQNNVTISGLSFDQKNDSVSCIQLFGCNNVHITLCRFANTKAFAVTMWQCTNVTIDYNFISNVAVGVMAQASSTIKVNSNQILNVNGNAGWKGHAIHLNGDIPSGGNQINDNIIVNQQGIAQYPHDMINIASSGLPGDSIQVMRNIISGGQYRFRPGMNAASDGATGVAIGDGNGNYIVERGNILITPGISGTQVVGTSIGIKIDHNTIYIKMPSVSTIAPIGISIQDKSPIGSVYVGYNRVLVYNLNGTTTTSHNPRVPNDGQPAFYNQPFTPTPIPGWNTNQWQDLTINQSLLVPTSLITFN